MQIIFYLYDDKVLILKCFLFLSDTKYRNLIQRKEYMGPHVAKMFFLLVDESFWLYWCMIQKYLN